MGSEFDSGVLVPLAPGDRLREAKHGRGSQRFIVDPTTGAILQAESERRGATFRTTYFKAGPADSVPVPTS